MPTERRTQPLSPEDRARLGRAIDAAGGPGPFAERAGVLRETLGRATAGHAVHAATAKVLLAACEGVS